MIISTGGQRGQGRPLLLPLLQTLLPFLFCTYGCKYSFHTQILTYTHPSYKHLKSEATTRTRGHICICCQVKKNPFSEVSWYLPEVALFQTSFPLVLHSWNYPDAADFMRGWKQRNASVWWWFVWLQDPTGLGLISSLNLANHFKKMYGKREPATRKTKEYLSLPLLTTAQLTSQPLCLEQEKNNRGSNDLGIKLRKKPQLTDVKAGRQPHDQTSRAQGLFRIHAGIFQIIFFSSFTEEKKSKKYYQQKLWNTT